MTEHHKDKTMMVEWNRQTPNDRASMDAYETLFKASSGSALSKLENFAKHTRRQRLSKFLAHYEIFKQICEVHGSIFDLGINAGQSLFTWAQLSAITEPLNYTRQIIGFDTFKGHCAISEKDRTGPSPSDHLQVGGFAYEDLQSLRLAIAAYDQNRPLGHIPKIEIVEGDILTTLPAYIEKNQHIVVSLLHLDTDLFEPTRLALKWVLPRMPKGAIIVFDELNQIPYPGETRAVAESIGLNSLRLRRFSWETGLSYAVIE